MPRFSGAALSIANRRKPRRRDRLVEFHLIRALRPPAARPRAEPLPPHRDGHRASARPDIGEEPSKSSVTAPSASQNGAEPVRHPPPSSATGVSRATHRGRGGT
jgi:hypothetical protein